MIAANASTGLNTVTGGIRTGLDIFLALPLKLKSALTTLAILFLAAVFLPVSAATATLNPDSTVSATGWTVTGAASAWDALNEGATPTTTDYIATGTAGSGGEVAEFGLQNLANVASATQVKVWVYAQSATNANGGTLDSLSLNARINGTLQTATTVTPAFGSWGWYSATFSGSWTQANIDSLQAHITRNVAGGGNPSNQDDDVRVATVYVEVTYMPGASVSQQGYRFYQNSENGASNTFIKVFGGSGQDYGYSIVQTADGGYVVGGRTDGYGGGAADAFLSKYDKNGNEVWNRTWGGTGNEATYSLTATSDGGFAVTGGTTSYGAGSWDAFIIKYDSNGGTSWSRTWGGSVTDVGQAITQTDDGGFVVAGYTASYGAGLDDAFIAKYDAAGTLSWSRTWGGSGVDIANSIVKTADGGFAITGRTASYGAGGDDAFVAKYDSAGTLSWNRTWGGSGLDIGYSIITTSDGGFAVAGESASFGSTNANAFLAKYDSAGTLSWSRTWVGALADVAYSLAQTSDGGYVIAGGGDWEGGGDTDVLLAKYDSAGTLSWSRTWGGPGASADYARSIAVTADGGYAVTGNTGGYGAGNNDRLLSVYDSTGSIANCSSFCQSPSITSNSVTASASSPTASASSPTPSTSSPSPVLSSPALTMTTVVSPLGPQVGTPLAAMNTPATAPAAGTPFRLRLNLGVTLGDLTSGSYKLRYAPRDADNVCDNDETGYTDITASTLIKFYDNASALDAASYVTSVDDPTRSGITAVGQTYEEANNFSVATTVPAGQDGLWDFALTVGDTAPGNTSYCIKATDTAGANLNGGYAASSIATITTLPPTTGQGSYRFFADSNDKTPVWAQAWGGTTTDYGYSLIQTSDGGYAVTGTTGSYGTGSTDAFLAKYDSAGNLSWSRTWGGTGYDYGNSLVASSDGGYAVTGQTYSYGTGSDDAFLAKYDSAGNLSWSRTWGDTGYDRAYSLVATADGGYAVTGSTTSYGTGSDDAFLAKYDSAGNLSWSRTWGDTGNDYGYSLVTTTDGGYAVTGETSSYGMGITDMFLARYDSAGNLSWSRTWGGTGYDYGNSLVATADGGYAVTGQTNSYGAGNDDMFLARYDSAGTLSWSRTWGGSGVDIANSIVKTADGGFAITGRTASYGAGNYDAFLARYDSTGNVSWSRTWGGTGTDRGYSLVQNTDGGYAITGETVSYGAGGADMFLATYDSTGTMANCPPSMCQSPLAGTSSPSPTTFSPTASTSSPTASTSSPTASTSSPTATVTMIVGGATVAGAPLAAQDAAAAVSAQTLFRLRSLVSIDGSRLVQSGQSMKLQYAEKSGSCDPGFSGEAYADVSLGGSLSYADNTSLSDAIGVSPSAADPTSGRPVVAQSYRETDPFTNNTAAIPAGSDGLWDFSLTSSAAADGKTYCLRIVKSDGSPLDSYNFIAEIQIGTQGGGGGGPTLPDLLRGGQSVIDGVKNPFQP